jgi:hypothetical protein
VGTFGLAATTAVVGDRPGRRARIVKEVPLAGVGPQHDLYEAPPSATALRARQPDVVGAAGENHVQSQGRYNDNDDEAYRDC